MFCFQQQSIVYSDGRTIPCADLLCKTALKNSTAGKFAHQILTALVGGEPLPLPDTTVTATIKNGFIYYNTENELEILTLCVSHVISHGITIRRCESCGRFFVPQKRADEKYCDYPPLAGTESCKKTGAIKAFRQRKSADSLYVQHTKSTKHLRYLKSVGKLSEAEYKRLYAEEKERFRLQANHTVAEPIVAELQPAAVETNIPKKTIETYLL